MLKRKLAILMTVHNRKEKTLSCLRHLYECTIPNDIELSVYLTDDGCTDGTADEVFKQFPEVNIVNGDGNLFWNRGMYKAWEEAGKAYDYDFYLWLNDDTNLLKTALLEIIETYNQNKNSIIVGCTCSHDGEVVTYGGLKNNELIKSSGVAQQCETFNGNIVLVPKTVYKKLGNLDWTYQHAIGDLDYGWQATRNGIKNIVTANPIGICENHSIPVKWVRSDVPLKERWKNFHSPLGYAQPGPFFHYNKKNFGLIRALKNYILNHIRLFFPSLWKN